MQDDAEMYTTLWWHKGCAMQNNAEMHTMLWYHEGLCHAE